MATLQKNTSSTTLNNGVVIPKVGFGTWRLVKPGLASNLVKVALENGYTHVDTARMYENEEEVGKGIAEASVDRKNIFVAAKLWNDGHKCVEKALDETLRKLRLEYVDLYLIHWPVSIDPKTEKEYPDWDFVDTYKQLQKIYKETNKVRAIGVSNFTIKKLERLLADPDVDVVPAVNQVESHPTLPQWDMFKYLQSKNIHMELYSPFGSEGGPELKNKTIIKIAEKNKVDPAQVLVSWAVQRDSIVLVKSATKERVLKNIKTFKLPDGDFAELNMLAENEGENRVNDLPENNFDN